MAIHRLVASQPNLPVLLSANNLVAEAMALIDTGASMTAVHPNIIEKLGALIVGSELVTQVGGGPRWEPTYYLTIRLGPESQGFGVESVAVAPASPCDVLIGRDLMGRWVFSWDGPGDQLIISY